MILGLTILNGECGFLSFLGYLFCSSGNECTNNGLELILSTPLSIELCSRDFYDGRLSDDTAVDPRYLKSLLTNYVYNTNCGQKQKIY